MSQEQPASRASGGEGGLIAAYLRARPNLVRFLAARTGSYAAAEDLAQEVYLRLAALPPDAPADNPTALIYRIALNLMLDKARGEARTAARETEWRRVTGSAVGGEDVVQEPPADEAAASRQRLRRLAEALEELPPQMRRAFRLHKLEGLSHAQTAQVMGLSAKTVEKHVSAALRALIGKLGR